MKKDTETENNKNNKILITKINHIVIYSVSATEEFTRATGKLNNNTKQKIIE